MRLSKIAGVILIILWLLILFAVAGAIANFIQSGC